MEYFWMFLLLSISVCAAYFIGYRRGSTTNEKYWRRLTHAWRDHLPTSWQAHIIPLEPWPNKLAERPEYQGHGRTGRG